MIARLGDDEFAILLPEIGHESGRAVSSTVEKLLLDKADKQDWRVSLSIGVVTLTGPISFNVDKVIGMGG